MRRSADMKLELTMLTSFPPLPSQKLVRELEESAYQLALTYKLLDEGLSQYVPTARHRKLTFIAKYKAVNFGESLGANFMSEMMRYAMQYEQRLKEKSEKAALADLSHDKTSSKNIGMLDDEKQMVKDNELPIKETQVKSQNTEIDIIYQKLIALKLRTVMHDKKSDIHDRLSGFRDPTNDELVTLINTAKEIQKINGLLTKGHHQYTLVANNAERLFTMLHKSIYGDVLQEDNFKREVNKFATTTLGDNIGTRCLPREQARELTLSVPSSRMSVR